MKLKKLKIKKFQGKSTKLHRSPGTHISDKCLSDFICPNLMEAFEIHPNIKVLSHKLSNVNADDDPEDALKLLDVLPNLEELTLELRCRIGLGNETEEMLRLVEVLKEVKARVGSFDFHLKCFFHDTKRLKEELEEVFEDLEGDINEEFVDFYC